MFSKKITILFSRCCFLIMLLKNHFYEEVNWEIASNGSFLGRPFLRERNYVYLPNYLAMRTIILRIDDSMKLHKRSIVSTYYPTFRFLLHLTLLFSLCFFTRNIPSNRTTCRVKSICQWVNLALLCRRGGDRKALLSLNQVPTRAM